MCSGRCSVLISSTALRIRENPKLQQKEATVRTRIIANGVRTDHPIPQLPFVDDSMLDLNDRHQIESIGRNKGEGLWGREDLTYGVRDGWRAFTTIPSHPNLAWVVKHHPRHGNVVVLVDDEDAVDEYSAEPETALIRRYGGYWWDGDAWHRSSARVDPVTWKRVYETVPGARSMTVGELLGSFPNHDHPAPPMTVEAMAANYRANGGSRKLPPMDAWVRHDLPVWLSTRNDPADADHAVVTLTAPELEPTSMLTTKDVAARAGVTESTVRAYRTRGQMPDPQIEQPTLWSVPVIERWLARRSADETPEPQLSEAETILTTIGHEISGELNGRRNRHRSQSEIARAVGRILDRYTLGLTTNDFYGAELHATYMAQDMNRSLQDDSFFPGLADRTMDHLILLAETKPRTARAALQRMMDKLMDKGHDRNEVLSALVDHPALRTRTDLRNWITAAVTPA